MRAKMEMNRTDGTMRTEIMDINQRMQGTLPASSNEINEINQMNEINEINEMNQINQINESEVRTVMGGIFGRRNHKTKNVELRTWNVERFSFVILLAVLAMVMMFGGAIPPASAYNAGDVIYVNATVSNYCPNGSQFDLIVTLTDFYGNPVTGLSSDNKNYGLILKNIKDSAKANVSYTGFIVNTQNTNAWTEIGNGQYKQTGTITSGTDPVYFDLEYRDPNNTNYKMKAAVMINRQGACSGTNPGILDSAPDYTYYPIPTGTVVIKARLKNQDGTAHAGANCPTGYDDANKWGGGTADTLYINNLKDVNNNNATSWSVTGCTDNGDGTYDITLNYDVTGTNDPEIWLPELRYDWDSAANIKMTTVAAFEVNSTQAPTNPTGTPPANPGCPECTAPADTTPPTEGTLSISPDDGTYTGPDFTITEDFTDNESAVTSCEYTIDGGTNWAAGTVSGTGPYTCTANVTGATGTVTVQMRATSAGGTSTPTNTITRTVDSTPPTDGTLTAVPGNTQISLSWTAASDTESGLDATNPYKLVRAIGATPPADCTGAALYQGTALTFTDTGLTNGQQYSYRVCAYDAMGNVSAGATASATPQACQATAPTDLAATNVTSSKVDLTWTYDGTNNDYYSVYRDGVQIATNITTGSYSDTTVSPNTTYNYTVRGYNNAGTCESGDSNVVNVTTPAGPTYTVTSCSDCHDYPPTDATGGRNTPVGAVIGSHDIHVNQNGLACTTCHIDNGTNLAHRNNQIDINASIQGGSYSTTDPDFPSQDIEDGTGLGSCVTTNCHGSSSPVWGNNTATPTCYKCHGTQANGNNAPPVDTNGDTAATDPQVGAHQAHLQATDNYSSPIACNECHTVPTNVFDTGHIDSALPAELTFGTLATTNGATPSYTGGTCSNTYCHDEANFKNAWGTGTPPTWNDTTYIQGTSADCSQCHGYPPGGGHPANATNCTSCHSHVNSTNDGFTDPTLHVNGLVEGGGDCLGCHLDSQQGTSRRAVRGDFLKTSHHVATGAPTDVLTCEACHGDLLTDQGHPGTATTDPITQVEDADTAGTYYSIDPSTADANLATFCLSCHDADGAARLGANATQPFADSGDTTTPPNINLAWTNTVNHSANATCNDCHGDNNAAGTSLDPTYNLHGSSNAKLLREATEYDTCVTSGCHGSGGSATTDMTVELSGIYGKHPIGSAVTPKSGFLSQDTAGDLFVNGWMYNSVAQCSDCHGMNQAGSNNVGPRGPHGSAYTYMLRGVDTSINTVTSGRTYGTVQNSSMTGTYTRENFCVNCHASDIYGDGNDGIPSQANTVQQSINANKNFIHYSTFRTGRCGTPAGGAAGAGNKSNVGCRNCHAGLGTDKNYGAHSSNTNGLEFTGNVGGKWYGWGTGFMNGDSWSSAPNAASSGKCYANVGTTTWNTCNKGIHN